jgi:lysyl-tRNA synthetase class 2
LEAFARYAGIDLAVSLADDGTGERDALAASMIVQGLRVAPDDSWSDLFAKVLTDRIEPQLGRDRLTVLCDYPACEAALARRKPDDPRLAERFELYACGVELCNGFSELTDPAEQRLRFEEEMREKQRRYGYSYPIDEDFLLALAAMPSSSGCAMGFDRLAMLASGARRIEDVLWTWVPEHSA